MFEGFAEYEIDTGEARIYLRAGGDGPPIVLLHGHPRTHATWHMVAADLARHFTVICPDLRGYGRSSKPATTADHEPYSKRAMAADIASVMEQLGHRRYVVIGHDRGAYVAFRVAMDFPGQVTRLVLLNSIPLSDRLDRCDRAFAASWWHWFFLGQTEKPAELVINADPDGWYKATAEHMGSDAFADYRRAIHDPETVHAMCEDYRAGLGIDYQQESADRRAGRRLACPLLLVRALREDDPHFPDAAEIWSRWADDVRFADVDGGHHLAEENPTTLSSALRDFLA